MIKATGTRYIIRPVELNKTTAGGIILQSTDDTQLAEIIAIGSRVEEPLPLGAKIVVNWNHTVPLKHENETFYVIESGAIAAVYEEQV